MREYLSDKQVKSELTALLQVVHEFLVEHGDYMKLPPEDQRINHGIKAWRELPNEK